MIDKKTHQRNRMISIINEMGDKVLAGEVIPLEWINELDELNAEIRGEQPVPTPPPQHSKTRHKETTV